MLRKSRAVIDMVGETMLISPISKVNGLCYMIDYPNVSHILSSYCSIVARLVFGCFAQ
jgi:hypothetical protein